MERIRRLITDFVPGNAQEEGDRAEMLRLIGKGEGLLHREGGAHFTASSWIMDERGERLAAVWHNIYRSWSWTGGHMDGSPDPLGTALREAEEETGITSAVPFDGRLFSLEILTVDGHEKRGAWVPSHLHLNLTFLLRASSEEALRPREGENRDARWFTPEAFLAACSEEWMIDRVYKKLIARFDDILRSGMWG